MDDDRLIAVTDNSRMDVGVEQDKLWSSMLDDDVGVEAISTVDYRPRSVIRMIERVHSKVAAVAWAVEPRTSVEEWEVVEEEVD